MSDYIAKWHRELEIFRKIKPVILLEGNVLDSYQYPLEGSISKGSIVRLTEYLHYYFRDAGYGCVVFYDSLRGFHNGCEGRQLSTFADMVGARMERDTVPARFKGSGTGSAPELVRGAMRQTGTATAVIMNYASRYVPTPDQLDQSEVDSFTVLLQAAMEARDVRTENGVLKNLLILIVNKANDVPAWFYLQNPNLKIITLGTPAKEEREQLVKGDNFPSFFRTDVYRADMPWFRENPGELEKIQDQFVGLTEGFSFTELNGLRRLCKNEGIRIRDMSDVIDLYKYGIRENPWKKLDIDALRNAKASFEARVKGQEHAITRTLDVVKRAVMGLSGLQGSSHTRPKGVLFFAGPTGTGKTETAKTLAQRLFGDERSCIRFDMSEYSQSHSDQKLLGAPPGYVGYESGGQLTNAVKNNPFSILLFDEIEKAHPSVLDKFLQILEDGRMTDGQGNTVYFSETIIIFTSNLGIYTTDRDGQKHLTVTPELEYPEIARRVRSAIEDYFKLELGRPEILNRIGENIVVFDFIRPGVAEQILQSQVRRIITSQRTEKNIELVLSDAAMDRLRAACMGNLSNGGRGIGNVVENLLLNPLSRYLFDHGLFRDATVTVRDITADSLCPELVCEEAP